jgi:hypothetical protein
VGNSEAEAYAAHLARYQQEFQPVGVRETQLVQNLADTQWRLDRIPNLEAGLFALGRVRYAELFPAGGDPQLRAALLDAHILMEEAKHFQNLHRQESRLRRQYRQDAQELKELQAQRKKEQEDQAQAKKPAPPPKTLAAANGFEFTNVTTKLDEQTKDRTEGESNWAERK